MTLSFRNSELTKKKLNQTLVRIMAHKSLAIMDVSTSQCNHVHCARDNGTLSKLLHCYQATRNKMSRLALYLTYLYHQ